ncbi:hypothetical protein HD554DRAFT_1320007 [Boletus coccyginus]|nr:hypothetical protein HD554DRAFT_1320007 [Boletus coccyginus]
MARTSVVGNKSVRNGCARVTVRLALHTSDPAVKLVTDRWVDHNIVMGKRQHEQYYSLDPAMIFSGVIACPPDLSVANLEEASLHSAVSGVPVSRALPPISLPSVQATTSPHVHPHPALVRHDAVRLGSRILETPTLRQTRLSSTQE